MGRHVIGNIGLIPDGSGVVVDVEKRSLGVFNVGGAYYALRNLCPHQSGPLCEGSLFPTHRARLSEKGRVLEYLDLEHLVIACPWHGWEFDLASGTCVADPNRRVATYAVAVEGDQIVVEIPDR